MNEAAYVAAIAAGTPVGRDAWSTAAAVRAGINGFVEHPYVVDNVGEPMRVCPAPWLDMSVTGTERLNHLLVPCLDSIAETVTAGGLSNVGLALGLPEPRPGVANGIDTAIRATVSRRLPGVFSAIATFPNGHASGLMALDAARRSIQQGRFPACVVAGVDSYIDPVTLEWLETNEQLHGAGALNNAWGFVPGEGAGAVLLVNRDALDQLRLPPLCAVTAIGQAIEQNRIKTETICLGNGLTTAFREALAALPAGERITDIFCDMNGEPYRADEFAFAALRTKEWFVAASDLRSPADCWGDVAAASGPLFVALATAAGVKGYANGTWALLWASSEGGQRAAAVLQTSVVA
jgi:3-oxoacyl-[acyl-carrier-protein] synthase-1